MPGKLLKRILETRRQSSCQRQKVLREKLHKAKDILVKEFQPKKIVLFGSLAEENSHCFSDIDIVVEGLGENYLKAGGRLIDVLGECIDLKPWELLDDNFRKEIIAKGKIIYSSVKDK